MDIEIVRNGAFDLAQKAEEFASAVTGIATPDDLAGRGVERGE
jgi:hypothetical protein